MVRGYWPAFIDSHIQSTLKNKYYLHYTSLVKKEKKIENKVQVISKVLVRCWVEIELNNNLQLIFL